MCVSRETRLQLAKTWLLGSALIAMTVLNATGRLPWITARRSENASFSGTGHSRTQASRHINSGKAPPDIPNPSDSSIALSTKDSFRLENPCQEQVLLASVLLFAERAAQNLASGTEMARDQAPTTDGLLRQ